MQPEALRISLIYCGIALLWIVLTDTLLEPLHAQNHALSRLLSTGKGIGFVVITSVGLYAVLRRQFARRRQGEHELEQERFINPIALLVMDRQGSVTYVNQRTQELFGILKGDLPGEKFASGEWNFTDYDGNPLSREQSVFQTVLRTRQPVFGIRNAVVTRTGQRLFLEINGAPLFDERGEVRAVVISLTDTTSSKAEEDRLRESEETFRLLFRNNPLPMWIYDLNTLAFLDVNDTAIDKYGYSHDEFMKMRLTDIRPPEDVERLLADVQKTRPDLQYSGEWRHKLKDGRLISVEITSHKLRYRGHDAALVVAQDVTERKQMIARLTESEERFRLLVEHAPIGFAIHHEGEILFANSAMAQLLGAKSPDEIIGTSIYEFVHPDYLPAKLEHLRALNTGESPLRHYENRYVRKDGSIIDVEATSVSMLYEGKRAIQLIAQDITERKLAEARINQLNAELERRIAERTTELNNIKDRVEAILNSSDDAIIFCRSGGQIEQVNPAFQGMFRMDREALIFRPLASLAAPDHRALVDEAFATVTATHHSQRIEITALCGDGSTFDADIMLSPVYQHEQGLVGVVASVRDVSQHRQMETKLRQMLQREMEISDLKSRYVSMAAHDLRNPLAAIQTSVSMIENYYERMSADSRRAKFDQIHEGVDVMRTMLDDILTIGQAESGKLKFSPAPIELEPYCRAIVNELLGANGIGRPVDFSVDGVCGTVFLDPKLLRHILANLISNAFRYSDPGSPVVIGITCDPAQVTIRVQDYGFGIPAQEQGRIFQSFFRASNAQHINGTGLGLAIVKQSVDLHHGDIWFESQEGHGTTFTVKLPIVSDPQSQPDQPA